METEQNGTGEAVTVTVDGEEEHKQHRRVNRFMNVFEEIGKADKRSKEAVVTGQMNPDGREVVLQNAVQRFIRELYSPLKNHSREAAGRDAYWMGDPETPLGVIRFSDGDDVLLAGLRDYLQLDDTLSRSWEETVVRRNKPPTVETKWETKTVPEEVTWGAFYYATEFASRELGLGLSVTEEESGEAEYEYADLLANGSGTESEVTDD